MALGLAAAALMVLGHHPWDGPVVEGSVAGHGLHVGDVLALVPVATSVLLARRWWRRRP